MRVIIQRSKNSSVSVDGKIVGIIDFGLVILVGFTYNDNYLTIMNDFLTELSNIVLS